MAYLKGFPGLRKQFSNTLPWGASLTSVGGLGAQVFVGGNKPGQPLGAVRVEKPPGRLHVLVTGGAGYIGSHAALRLLEVSGSRTPYPVGQRVRRSIAGSLKPPASLRALELVIG